MLVGGREILSLMDFRTIDLIILAARYISPDPKPLVTEAMLSILITDLKPEAEDSAVHQVSTMLRVTKEIA